MSERIAADICVIGGGSGGLSVAAGASQMGARVVLVERGRMGGDCLNFGCVPSKAMIAAAHAAQAVRDSGRFGIDGGAPRIDFARVHDHVHGVIAAIAPHDSVERFEGLGVRVIQAHARFTGPATVEAGGVTIEAKRFVIATGSSAAVPPVPGIDGVPYLTNETVFDLTEAPSHLIVIGGGPIGCELAQAYRRLGARVTVLEMFRVLGRDDPELAEIVKNSLRADGVELNEDTRVLGVEKSGAGIAVRIEDDGAERTVEGSHLLVAAGRTPNIDGLDLEKAGIAHDRRGITVDAGLRTTNRRAYAIGDVAGGLQFTHLANYHAGVVIRRVLFRMFWVKTDDTALPRVTFTDPELAHVGLDETRAREKYGDIRVLRHPFAENDRAQAERRTTGHAKIVTTKRGVVVGASIVGAQAGELIQGWILPVQKRMKVSQVAGLILPYPTLGEVNKRAAGNFYTPALFSNRTRRIVGALLRLG